MANPKRRHSHARKNRRRAHDHLELPALAECPHCHETKLAHQACKNCGQYRGRPAVFAEQRD